MVTYDLNGKRYQFFLLEWFCHTDDYARVLNGELIHELNKMKALRQL